MADIDLVRMLVGDRKKAAVNEEVGEGDGVNRYFRIDMFPTVSSPTASLALFLTGVTAATNTYTVSGDVGRITFSAGNAPAAGATLLANYEYYALSSGEMSEILSGHTGSPYLAAANAALVIAADATRLFMYTMGDKTVDKRRTARNLLDLSAELENRHYKMRDDGAINAKIFTFKDDSGTYYDGYDTSTSYLTATD